MFFTIVASITIRALGSLVVRTAAVVGTTALVRTAINNTHKTGGKHDKDRK